MIFIKNYVMAIAAATVLSWVTFAGAASAKKAERYGEVVDMGIVTDDGTVITDKSEEKAYLESIENAPKPPTFIPHIIGKSKGDVNKILDEMPKYCEKSNYGINCRYEHADVDIVYINNKSDWITIHNPNIIGFYAGALSQIGLDCPIEPSHESEYVIRWDNKCVGIQSASLFPGRYGGGPFREISYIYIKSATP